MEYFVYILKSLSNPSKTYVGYTSNLILRMQEHNITNNYQNAHTKKFRPWEVIYIEYYDSKLAAMNREKWFKSGVGREWVKKILIFLVRAQSAAADITLRSAVPRRGGMLPAALVKLNSLTFFIFLSPANFVGLFLCYKLPSLRGGFRRGNPIGLKH